MKTINHESDFKLKVGYSDGSPINEPFRFTFYTKVSRGTFIAEYNGSEYVNCYPDGGMVKIPFDKPMLGMGLLSARIELFISDADFKDGKYDYVSEEPTGIILDKGATEPFEDMELLISKPNTRGLQMFLSKPFTDGGGGGYEPPEGGIPLDDLSEEVKESLNKANTAIQAEETEDAEQVDDYNLMGSDISQELGDSTKKVMSQRAIKEVFMNVNSEISDIKSSIKLSNAEILTLSTDVNSLKNSIITVLNTAI